MTMRSYTVHRRIRSIGDAEAEARDTAFIGEGFSWAALIVPVLWLLYHRMWLVLLGFLALVVALNAGLAALDAQGWVVSVANLALSFAFAGEAQSLRRWALGRNGYEFVGVVLGRDLMEAETRYFRGWTRAILAHRAEAETGEGAQISFRQQPAEPVGALFPKDRTV